MLKEALKRILPNAWFSSIKYWRAYQQATQQLGNRKELREKLFQDMIRRSYGYSSMQVGVREAKYAPHWISVDLYDTSYLIDYNYDINDLKFPSDTFDFVACLAVLEHIPTPQQAIAEMCRVLKPGGEIWVEVPFNQPYHLAPKDYWRVTPDGLRIWMQNFTELNVGLFSLDNNPIYNGIFIMERNHD